MYLKSIITLLILVFSWSSVAEKSGCRDRKDDLWIDHIAIGVPDLQEGVKAFEAMTGLKPQFGGNHANGVTGNYILSIGPCTYLEILGRVADGILPAYASRLDTITGPEVFYYVLGTNNMQALSAKLEKLGIKHGDVGTSSRARPDGVVLNWRTIGIGSSQFGSLQPYVIDWLDSEHPAESSNGADDIFDSLTLMHPRASEINELFAKIGTQVRVKSGSESMQLVLNTPKGRKEFTN